MVRFIHISDPHFCSDYTGSRITRFHDKGGRTLTEQFISGMGYILEKHPNVDFFLLSGDILYDIAHKNTVEEYIIFRRLMDTLTGGKSCYITPGNHDSDMFRSAWPELPWEGNDYAITEPKSGLRIISLDSRGGSYGTGRISAGQLVWLRERVSSEYPSVLILHHTPHISSEIEYLTYQMENPLELYTAIEGSGVLGIFSGHTHICFESMLGSIPCHTTPSISFGIITGEDSMTLTDSTGFNYCIYSDGKLTVRNEEIPGVGISERYDYSEL